MCLDNGVHLKEAQTLAVTVVILLQIFYLFNCRSLKESFWKVGVFSNPWIYGGAGLLLVLQAAFVHMPSMNTLFGSAPLSAQDWLLATVLGFAVVPVISIEKWLRQGR